ncbi:uncharacterized protein LOC122264864 [Penaeus japonicus]|uniref:uncharacterized protein LOC122264864 n=1 Tax=Penaeus japonicus TaxID=27405 RepID=UPI001C70D514|nr:uncharacterized protein LOC122264864 [Penaeus japonicus]
MLYGLETAEIEGEIEGAEMKILKFSLEAKRKDKIRNENIKGTTQFGNKARGARLRWFEDVMRRDEEHVGRRMLDMEPPERRKREKPKKRFMDAVRGDMKAPGLTEKDAEDRGR